MKLDTELMRQRKEQAELAKQLKELERDDLSQTTPSPSPEEKYAKAMEEERRKQEHQLAVEAMKEMMLMKRFTEQVEFVTRWQEKIRKEYPPDIAEAIIDTFDRIQAESDS